MGHAEGGLIVEAHAKLNLGLRVLGRRADGYHDIASLFQEVDFGDALTLTPLPAPRVELTTNDRSLPTDASNLVVRAARLLQDGSGPSGGVRIDLDKRIPVGAGLGGGSSDAAAALVGLNRLWDLGFDEDGLAQAALALGSDVPFFVRGGAAVVSGRGETIQPVAGLREVTFVLVHPGFAVETAWAYANVGIGLTEGCPYLNFLNSASDSREVESDALFACLRNDFLPLLADRHPEVRPILDTLNAAGCACASVTGSGSVLFGCFRQGTDARAAADRLGAAGYRAWLARPAPLQAPRCRVV